MMKNKIKLFSPAILKYFLAVILVLICSIGLNVFLQLRSVTHYKPFLEKYSVGMISEDDVLLESSIDIIDENATANNRMLASKSVLPVFSYSAETTYRVLSDFVDFSTYIHNNGNENLKRLELSDLCDLIRQNNSMKALSVAYEIINEIMKDGFFSKTEIAEVESSGYYFISVINNYLNDYEYSREMSVFHDVVSDDNISAFINATLDSYKDELTVLDRNIIKRLITEFCEVNVSYDAELTESRRYEAYQNADVVVVSMEEGMQILKKDTVITEEQINNLRLICEKKSLTLSDLVSPILFNLICLGTLFYIFGYILKNESLHENQYLWLMVFFACVICAVTYICFIIADRFAVSFYLATLPVGFLPIFLTMITGKKRIGFIGALITSIIVKSIPSSDYIAFFYSALCGMMCCYIVRFFNRRLDMFLQWLFSCLATTAVIVFFMFMTFNGFTGWGYALGANIIHMCLCSIFLSFIVPILERLMNLPTLYRLYELSYGNSPLLEKLDQIAPGTYSHSRAVADLASDACEKIGANDLLAKAGALYHDIGKMEHPEYFVENQSGDNKHDNLTPSLSVSVIKNHVKVGADKAREARLPVEIIDIVANHHGNDIIQFFYNEAKKQADVDEQISSQDYSYNNSKIPETKECAVVMLADSVEAAARTVNEPTTAKFTKLIENIVMGKINRGQLNNCNLSMKDITVISESFLKTLTSQYHSRIEYPNEEENNGGNR